MCRVVFLGLGSCIFHQTVSNHVSCSVNFSVVLCLLKILTAVNSLSFCLPTYFAGTAEECLYLHISTLVCLFVNSVLPAVYVCIFLRDPDRIPVIVNTVIDIT